MFPERDDRRGRETLMLFSMDELRDLASRASDDQLRTIFNGAALRESRERMALFSPGPGWLSSHLDNQFFQTDDVIVAFGEEILKRKQKERSKS
jgi:hypothetical protein